MRSSKETVIRSSGSDRVLVIMAKAPRPGAVKTRLVPRVPADAVVDFYCCLLDDTLALARSLRHVKVAIMCPESDVDELAQLAGGQATVVAQRGEGLASGLTSVFAHFTANQRRTIAFNSDSPHLPRSVLEEAFETLAAHDVVVGQTHDGGYYLVGAKASYPTLFANDGMGTASALERLLLRARILKLSVGFAEPFYDIDVADDLTRLAEELRVAPERAPRTAQWLKERYRQGSVGFSDPGIGGLLMSSPKEARAFELLDEYSKRQHKCFVAEMFLNVDNTEYTICFRPTGLTNDSPNAAACRYFRAQAAEVNEIGERGILTDSFKLRLDKELPALHQ